MASQPEQDDGASDQKTKQTATVRTTGIALFRGSPRKPRLFIQAHTPMDVEVAREAEQEHHGPRMGTQTRHVRALAEPDGRAVSRVGLSRTVAID